MMIKMRKNYLIVKFTWCKIQKSFSMFHFHLIGIVWHSPLLHLQKTRSENFEQSYETDSVLYILHQFIYENKSFFVSSIYDVLYVKHVSVSAGKVYNLMICPRYNYYEAPSVLYVKHFHKEVNTKLSKAFRQDQILSHASALFIL